MDPHFPNLRPEVVRGYLEAPDTMVVEVMDGELSRVPRPRPRHANTGGPLLGRLHGFSDRTEAHDRGPKRRIYRREGVGHLWLCDPRIHTLEVYRLEGGRWSEVETYAGDVKARIEPFEALALDLAALWRW